MESFVTGLVCGAVGVIMLANEPEPKVVEVLPQEYQIVTSLSERTCSGPTGKETIAYQRVRTQTID